MLIVSENMGKSMRMNFQWFSYVYTTNNIFGRKYEKMITFFLSTIIYIRSYMSAHVLLNLLNQLRKKR